MDNVKEASSYERISGAYSREVRAGIVSHLNSRKKMSLGTDALELLLLDDRLVRFAAGMRPSRYDSDIVITLALVGMQDKELLKPALELAEQMKRYPDDCMYALRTVSETLAMSIRLQNFRQIDSFAPLAAHVITALSSRWKREDVVGTMELIDKSKRLTSDAAETKTVIGCDSDLNDIARLFKFVAPPRKEEAGAGDNSLDSLLLSENEIYRREEYDALQLSDVQKRVLAAISQTPGNLNEISHLAGRSQSEVDRALRFLSDKSLVAKNRAGHYSTTWDGRQYAMQHDLHLDDEKGAEGGS
ncbi:MAG: hypothetical protein M1286_00165 [Candidatus Marsarchaeota archaeon]|nr:hypothetical protein [Candidatus Marsarchaeota archaeon]